MLRMRDDMGRDVILVRVPQRVVSLVPSDTYNLFALGAGERLVGRTRYCALPGAALAAVPDVGGTKDVDPDAVAALAPDLVLANQEENARPPLEELARRGFPIMLSFPCRFADGVAHLARLARALGLSRSEAATRLIGEGYRLIRPDAQIAAERAAYPRAFVPVWKEPLMTMNQDAFASDLLLQAGFENAFADRERQYPLAADLGRRSPLGADRAAGRDRRYPRITVEELVERAPDVVLLPDEPHEFGREDVEWMQSLDLPAARRGEVHLVSGRDLFWYGARAIEALPRLRALVQGSAMAE